MPASPPYFAWEIIVYKSLLMRTLIIFYLESDCSDKTELRRLIPVIRIFNNLQQTINQCKRVKGNSTGGMVLAV